MFLIIYGLIYSVSEKSQLMAFDYIKSEIKDKGNIQIYLLCVMTWLTTFFLLLEMLIIFCDFKDIYNIR